MIFSGSQISQKMTVLPSVNSHWFPVRKDNFALESNTYYHHLDEISHDSLKLQLNLKLHVSK